MERLLVIMLVLAGLMLTVSTVEALSIDTAANIETILKNK